MLTAAKNISEGGLLIALAEMSRLAAFRTPVPFYDMGTPERLKETERALDDYFPHAGPH